MLIEMKPNAECYTNLTFQKTCSWFLEQEPLLIRKGDLE